MGYPIGCGKNGGIAQQDGGYCIGNGGSTNWRIVGWFHNNTNQIDKPRDNSWTNQCIHVNYYSLAWKGKHIGGGNHLRWIDDGAKDPIIQEGWGWGVSRTLK